MSHAAPAATAPENGSALRSRRRLNQLFGSQARRSAFAAVTPLLVVALAASACSKHEKADPSTYPTGATVLQSAATAMASLQTVHIVVELNPGLGNPALDDADLDLTAKGESQGTVTIETGGIKASAGIVTLPGPDGIAGNADDQNFLQYPGQPWKQDNLIASIYDVSAILDPNRGIPKLLATAQDATTTGDEVVETVDCWDISATLDGDVIKALIPATLPEEGITAILSVEKDGNHLRKAVISVPAGPHNPRATITFTLRNFDKEVNVVAPV